MTSWSDWDALWLTDPGEKTPAKSAAKDLKGVYVLRLVPAPKDSPSDIIYIGCAGSGDGGLENGIGRLRRSLSSLEKYGEREAEDRHCAARKIWKLWMANGKGRLELSWLAADHPDAVEKAFLLAFQAATGRLPLCNSRF